MSQDEDRELSEALAMSAKIGRDARLAARVATQARIDNAGVVDVELPVDGVDEVPPLENEGGTPSSGENAGSGQKLFGSGQDGKLFDPKPYGEFSDFSAGARYL